MVNTVSRLPCHLRNIASSIITLQFTCFSTKSSIVTYFPFLLLLMMLSSTAAPARCWTPAPPLLWPASIPRSHLIHSSSYSAFPQSFSLVCACAKFESVANGDGRPTTDTRIHWASSDEGWIGIPDSSECDLPADEAESISTWQNCQNGVLTELFVHPADSHYRYLHLTPDAEADEIKAAYRRLSKTYHPDATSLPLEIAAAKFVRLKEAYSVLSHEQKRRYYDWQLAQEISRQQGGRFILPYVTGKTPGDDSLEPVQKSQREIKDPVDIGENIAFSDQALAALAFDAFAVLVSILCITYAYFFKQT